MINHVRTLLLNRAGDHGYGWDFPGEEFVPPLFKAKTVPAFLQSGLKILFGANPDRLFLNYRMRQIMTLLHSTELAEFVLGLDSRVTYWPVTSDEFVDTVFQPAIERFTGPGELFLVGSHTPDDGAGSVELQWLVEVLSGGLVQVTRQTPPMASEIYAYTTSKQLSSQVPLMGTGYSFRLQGEAVGSTWLVVSRVRPAKDFSETLQSAAKTMGIDLLFLSPTEPVPTLRSIWGQHPLFAYKYGALLLGIAYYLNEN